jgi:hypothetical protein
MIRAVDHYRIYAALSSEAREGWVWLPRIADLTSKTIRIRRSNYSVVCEKRIVDTNFRAEYHSRPNTKTLPDTDDFIVISTWYKEKLGIFAETECTLQIQNADGFVDKHFRAFLDHPNPAIRVSIVMGTISLALGVLGPGLAILSIVLALR